MSVGLHGRHPPPHASGFTPGAGYLLPLSLSPLSVGRQNNNQDLPMNATKVFARTNPADASTHMVDYAPALGKMLTQKGNFRMFAWEFPLLSYDFTESQVHVRNGNCMGLLSSPVPQHIMNVIEGVSGERILQIANDVRCVGMIVPRGHTASINIRNNWALIPDVLASHLTCSSTRWGGTLPPPVVMGSAPKAPVVKRAALKAPVVKVVTFKVPVQKSTEDEIEEDELDMEDYGMQRKVKHVRGAEWHLSATEPGITEAEAPTRASSIRALSTPITPFWASNGMHATHGNGNSKGISKGCKRNIKSIITGTVKTHQALQMLSR